MTDISMLFTTPLINKSLEPFSIESRISKKSAEPSLPSTSRKTDHWDMAELEAAVRKGIKKQVSFKALSDEVDAFSSKQKEQYIKKTLIFGGILLYISYVLSFDRRIVFEFALLLLLKLVPSLPFQMAQEKIIRASAKIINPIVYSALFYYLLKWATNANMNEMNLSLTIISIIFTLVYVAVEYFQPCFKLSTEHLVVKNIFEQTLISTKTVLFVSYLYQRIKFYINIKRVLFLTFLVSCIVNCAILFYFKADMTAFFRLKNFLAAILIFFLLEVLLLLFRFIDLHFQYIKALKNKLPVFMSLLRLEGSSSYRKAIQDKCLLNILYKMSQISCFLATQTCKSLTYNTYMDIVNQFAAIELERTHSTISRQLGAVSVNRSVIDSKKTLTKDLFIHFRKLKAYISQQHLALTSLESLSQTILLMKIIALSDQQAYIEKETLKVNPRIVDMMQMIQQKFGKLASESTIMSSLRGQLVFNERKLGGWICSMRKGWI